MSSSDVQLAVVLAVVAGAIVVLVGRARAVFRGTGGCGSGTCGACPSAEKKHPTDASGPPGFVPVESLIRSIESVEANEGRSP